MKEWSLLLKFDSKTQDILTETFEGGSKVQKREEI